MESGVPIYDLMPEDLQKISDGMVFEGVTAKEGMKRVKAVQKLWKSDSFEILKSLLEEEPIQDGKFRVQVRLSDAEKVDQPTTSQIAFEKEKTERRIAKMKEDLRCKYESILENDLEVLKYKADEIMKSILDQTREMFQVSEAGQFEDAVREKLELMKRNIKYFKKQKKKEMKAAVRQNIEEVLREINEYTETDVKMRIKTFKQLLEKLYDFQIKRLTEDLIDQHQNNNNQRIRLSLVKFNLAKEKLLKKHMVELQNLECVLENELNGYKLNSANRMATLIRLGIEDIDHRSEIISGEDESMTGKICIEKMLTGMQDEGLLPEEVTPDEDWEAIVCEMLEKYQIFIELVLGHQDSKQNQYLLSMEKLSEYQNRISKLTMKRLRDTKPSTAIQKNQLSLHTSSAILLEKMIRDVTPPNQTSRFSLSKNSAIDCSNSASKVKSLELNRVMSQKERRESERHSIAQLKHSYDDQHSRHSVNQIESNTLDSQEREQTDLYTESNKVEHFVKTCQNDPKLYNIFFYGI